MATSRTSDFDGFYAATATRVVGYLCVVLGDAAEAEDAAHEAYARAWQRWAKVREFENPEAWVRTVAFRIAMNSWRKAKNRLIAQRRNVRAERRHDPDPAERSQDRLAVVEALRRISAEQRQALVLFHVQGLTVAEIAHETGTPVGTIKARLSRGRKALAPYVSEFVDDEDVTPSAPARPSQTGSTARPANSTASNARKEMVSGA